MIETDRRSLFQGALAFLLVPVLSTIPAIANINPQVERYNSYIRQLTRKLETDISQLLQYVVFEPNDEYTRWQVQNIVSMYLTEFQMQGSYIEGCGKAFLNDWRVTCDKTNNPVEIIGTNKLVVDIYVRPSKSVDFIKLQGLIDSGIGMVGIGGIRKLPETSLSEENIESFNQQLNRERSYFVSTQRILRH